ncbi:MAG: purine-nucleoside phosphorylase [Frankiaceae bacterium]
MTAATSANPPDASAAALAASAAAALAERSGVAAHDVAVILGSGWGPAADVLGTASVELPATALPGFAAPTVLGHAGTLRSVDVGGTRVLVQLGRTHLYEGRGVPPVVHGVRTAIAAGCRVVILTNAAGALRTEYAVGQPVLIRDHLNFTWQSPLSGADFVDLTDLYAPRLRSLARTVDPSLVEGVYAAMPGPQFETPAENAMLRTLGADLVGMSTVLEAIAARAGGAEVLAISLVTNAAAGVTGEPLDHHDVLAAGAASAVPMGELLRAVIGRL